MSNLSSFLKSFDNNSKQSNENTEEQKVKGQEQKTEEKPSEMLSQKIDTQQKPEQQSEIKISSGPVKEPENKSIKKPVINKPNISIKKPTIKKPVIARKPGITKKPIINQTPKQNVESKPPQTINVVEKVEEIQSNIVQESEEEKAKRIAEELFVKSETPIEFKEQWMQIYNKGLSSTKNTMTSQKVKKGRFRLDSHGEIEILADFDTYGKSSKDLLKLNWQNS